MRSHRNGGTLLAYDLGKDIDSADVIIRLNAGPIKGFEKKVGSRTDYRLVNRLHMGFRETKEEMVLQHCTTRTHWTNGRDLSET